MYHRQFLAGWLNDIRFWIILFFIIHLCTITLPPLEAASTWRQTDGLMVARNFYEQDPNIFYPRVDVAGEKSGIVGCEFPLLNYLIYLFSLVFGFESWYGRLINCIVSSIGILFFFRLIRKYFDETSAFNASLLVLVSIWFTYSRTNIPDTFGASLCIISVFFCTRYLEEGHLSQLLLFFSFALLGCLSKISSAAILTVVAIPFLFNQSSALRKIAIAGAAIVVLLSVYGWYFVWVPHLTETYGFSGHFFMGMSFMTGANQLLDRWPETLARFYSTPFKYIGSITFLAALITLVWKKKWLNIGVFLVPFTAFLVIVIKSGDNFLLNGYYVIMFIMPMAFLMGNGLAQVNRKIAVAVILLAVGTESLANQVHVLQIRQPFKSLEDLENILDSVSSKPGERIAINSDAFGNPTPMYFAHRRGWVITNETLLGPEYLQYLKNNDCKHIVILKKLFGSDLELALPEEYDSEYFKIYKLPSPYAAERN